MGSRRSAFTLVGRVALASALLIGLVAAGPSTRANAATISWTAQNQFSEGIFSQEDAVANAPQPVQRSWNRSTYLNGAAASWPVTVDVDTMLPPSALFLYPPTTPTPNGALSRYTWSVTTGAFISIFGNERPLIAPGFSVARELEGGRVVPAGASQRRHYVARFVPDHAMPFYSVEIQFTARFGTGTTPPPMPVTPSDITCTPAPTYPQDAQRPQWTGSAVAGVEVRIDCDVTLTNTTASAATYTPSLGVFEGLASSYVSLPPGATTADHDDPILGHTRYTVTPPSGTAFDGYISNFRDRYVSLAWLNEIERGTPWYATYERGLIGAAEEGDAMTNAPRSFGPQSFMYIQSPGWPSRIEARTTLPTSRLEAFPSVTPVIAAGVATYTWEGSATFVSGLLRDTSPVTMSPGFTMARALAGGRELAPRAVVDREFRVDLHLVDVVQLMSATIVFEPSFSPPGATPRAVRASNVSCPGGEPLPGNPGIVNWFNLPTTAGSDAHLVCTVRLENTTSDTARYTPDVSVRTVRSLFQAPRGPGASVSTDDPALGSVSFSVTPPAGTQADLYFGRYESLTSSLVGQNVGATTMPWNAQVTERGQFFTSNDDAPDVVRPFDLSWNFSARSAFGWPTSITAATTLNTTGWFAAPSVTPTIVGGTTTYRWTGSGSLFAFLSSLGTDPSGTTRVSMPDLFGASLRRESIGGTRIDPGATVHRQFVVRLVGTTNTTGSVSVFLTSGTAGTPNPVLVTDQQCTGGTVLGGLPGGFGWTSFALPQGAEVRFDCQATLTNTSSRPATYMPVVIANRASVTPQDPVAADRFEVDLPTLGTVILEVTPPAGTTAIGTLVNVIERSVFLGPNNRALEPTELTYVGDTSAYHGEAVTLAARLRSPSLGTPFVGQTLRFEVDGNTFTAVTGADGVARVSIPGGLGAVGTHHVTVSFPENDFFLGATASADVTVLARPTALTYTGQLSSTFGFTTLSARLVDSRSGAPIPGKSIKFTIDGQDVGTATTNAAGDASLVPATPPLPTSRTVVATFEGDATLAGTHVSAQLAIANSVGKVTADATTANGAAITLSIRSDGTSVSGDLTLVTPARRVVAQIIALGLSSDGTRAIGYGRTAAGEDVLLDLTDSGEPGRDDRITIRVAGAPLTGDGSLATGNAQIHKLK